MSKICPNCQEVFDDSHAFCSNCGSRLIDNVDVNPAFNLGDANAISGGVSINQSKNITSHDTHYHTTTVQERVKSESELKLDATNQLRAKAEEIMSERGRIDSAAMNQLRPLSKQLGIDDETFKSIIKDVRSNRNGAISGLSAANARYLQQAQQAVKTNDMDALSNLTPRLEAMAAISQDDNVQFMYYLTLSILYPIKSMEVYERQMDENYWRTFWAIISYIRTGKHAEAAKVLALFDPLRYEKSEEDQNLLEAYFNIMKEDKDGAQEFLDEILGEPTEQVKPLLRAVESTLYEEEPESLEVRFYMERVMSKSDVVVKSQKKTETPAAKEEPKTAPKPEKKAEPQPKAKAEETPAPEIKKDNKEADELYAKACAASGAKRVMLLQKAADAGSLDAMCELSDCYYDGEGVDKNIALAVKWMSKAADMGSSKAQLQMGGVYYKGVDGIDQNYVLAEKYLLQAAKSDIPDGQAMLADLYFTMEEYEKSLVWARKAAQLGHSYACFILGRIYDEGLGVDANHTEGLKWFEKSADAGDADAQNIVGNIFSNGESVAKDDKKAFKYYQMAAVQGHLWGMYNLSGCYVSGQGTDLDLLKAGEWLRKAAEGGLQEAIDTLNDNPQFKDDLQVPLPEPSISQTIENNDISELPTDEELKKWRKLAKDGDSNAMLQIGLCYHNGNGVSQNYAEASKWFRKAADLGNAEAQFQLGEKYTECYGCVQNFQEAAKWYRKAANLDHPESLFKLGLLYKKGQGVVANQKKANELISRAAELGFPDAVEYLGNISIPKTNKQPKNNPQSKPTAEINRIWVDCDGHKLLTFHCDFEACSLKGEPLLFFIHTIKHKFIGTTPYDFKQTIPKVKNDSTRMEDFPISININDLFLKHDHETMFTVVVEIWQTNKNYTPKKLLAKSQQITIKIWSYFNFFSKDRLEVRDVVY